MHYKAISIAQTNLHEYLSFVRAPGRIEVGRIFKQLPGFLFFFNVFFPKMLSKQVSTIVIKIHGGTTDAFFLTKSSLLWRREFKFDNCSR